PRGAGPRDRRAQRAARPLSAAEGDRGQHPGRRLARRRRRDALAARLGGRLAAHRLRQEPDRARPVGDGEPARRLHRPPDRAEDQQAGAGRHRPHARLRAGARDEDVPGDQLAAGPPRPARRACAGGGGGGRPARDRQRRAFDGRARLPGARRRPGAPRVDDEGAGPEHADVAADQEAARVTFREDGEAALEWAASYLERVRELPVLAQVQPGEIRAALPDSPPELGEPFADVLRDLEEVLLPGITHWQHPGFFAYFATTGSEPGILAELLAATLNVTQILWRTSPAATELEVVVMDWLAQLLGLPRGWHGHIEDTASTSTLAALAAAREANPGRVVLCSEHAHSSVEKAARLLGLAVQKVPADARFRMKTDRGDLEGACALVATVGTTASTSVDPVAELADICERQKIWLHVDAAYAGSAMVCPEFRWAWEGI